MGKAVMLKKAGSDKSIPFSRFVTDTGGFYLTTLPVDDNGTIELTADLQTISNFNSYTFLNGLETTGSNTTVIINILLNKPVSVGSHCFKYVASSKLKKVILNFPNGFILKSTDTTCFYDSTKITEINGEIDMSQCVSLNAGSFQHMLGLEKIFFKPNSASIMINFNGWGGCPLLVDESIISIANGLNESVTGQTLNLHATPKAKCSTIMGTVALDETQTYHVFTQDASGTVTLADFITNTKGWTLG